LPSQEASYLALVCGSCICRTIENGNKIAADSRVVASITSEQSWIEFLRGVRDWLAEPRPTVVVSPHPDDETLGAGGLIVMQRSRRIPVELLAVTDGEAAYPDMPDLGTTRQREQTRAAEALGLISDAIVHLGLRDSNVAGSEAALADRITEAIDSDTLLVAPWQHDPHPDHEACGRAAAAAARRTGATLVSYFFWTWHRLRPESLAGLPLRRMILSAEARTRRAKALACHRSQLHRNAGPPILPECFLAPARRPFETFIVYGD
jgi:LmbE family N-acetylglucosaminyl deacetylase